MAKTIPLIARLRCINRDINNLVDCLNYGGCGLFASRIGKAIHPYVDDLECCVIAYPHNYDPDINLNTLKTNNSNLNSIRDWSENGVSFNHVVIRFKYRNKIWYYDSENLDNSGEYIDKYDGKILDGYLTVEEITNLSDNPVGWNPNFDRDDNIPIIEQIISQYIM